MMMQACLLQSTDRPAAPPFGGPFFWAAAKRHAAFSSPALGDVRRDPPRLVAIAWVSSKRFAPAEHSLWVHLNAPILGGCLLQRSYSETTGRKQWSKQ
jgi:hypothetical protein